MKENNPNRQSGQPNITLNHESGASAEIYQHGAHLTSWQSAAGKNWIFTSEKAIFDGQAAIRGGVPIIFPQFNEFGSGPRHGFARNTQWQIKNQTEDSVTFTLGSSGKTTVWPFHFQAEYCCSITSDSLSMQLTITNTDNKPFEFTAALHTYFQIDSLQTAKLKGLNSLKYWDNDGSDFSSRQTYLQDELSFADAIDRVFFDYQQPLVLRRGINQLKIEHFGFQDVVVWNPGAAAAKTMKDFADHEYSKMLCIEAAQIAKPITLNPGESWRGEQLCHDFSKS